MGTQECVGPDSHRDPGTPCRPLPIHPVHLLHPHLRVRLSVLESLVQRGNRVVASQPIAPWTVSTLGTRVQDLPESRERGESAPAPLPLGEMGDRVENGAGVLTRANAPGVQYLACLQARRRFDPHVRFYFLLSVRDFML